jgi:Glycosyltransferase family 92
MRNRAFVLLIFAYMIMSLVYTSTNLYRLLLLFDSIAPYGEIKTSIYRKLDEELYVEQRNWYQARLPVLVASIANYNDVVFYSLFNMNHFKWNIKLRRKYLRYRWMCKYRFANHEKIFRTSMKVCPNGHSAIIECPMLNTSDISLQFQNISYNLSKFLQINLSKERLDIHQLNKKKVSFAACTSVQNMQNLLNLKGWIIYHQLIGIQYFWIYFDRSHEESIHALKYFERLSFVRIFQYNFNFSNVSFNNQQAIQNECIYRSKALRIKWLALMDIDEFFTIVINPEVIEKSNKSPIDFLTKSINNLSELGGIRFKNWFYGKNYHDHISDLVLDYTAKSHSYLLNERQKLLVLPENVKFFSVHTITEGLNMYELSPDSEGFVAHFKNANEGVFGTKRCITDDYFKTKFAQRIRGIVKYWDSRLLYY